MANVKVRMLVSLAGERFVVDHGQEYECDAAEAKRLIDAGFAEPVASKAKTQSRESKVAVAGRAD